jgi:methyl-accepting chemotaxis protein
VGANITAIQQSTDTSIKEMGIVTASVTAATEHANASGQALAEIVNLAAANSAVVSSIATTAEEQGATSEEINQSVNEICRIVADTSDGMIQAAQAVQDLAQSAQELNRVMGELQRS